MYGVYPYQNPIHNQQLMEKYTKLKDQGNQLFKQKKFTQAIEVFQSVIDLINKQQPSAQVTGQSDLGQIFIIVNSNAAFAALNLKDKQHYVLAETYCSAALKVDPQHQKALYRRALANKQLAELLEIESNGTSQELLTLYNKAKKDLEDIAVIDKANEIAKQKLYEVVKNIYRVTVTQGKEINLSGGPKVEEAKIAPGKNVEKKIEAPKVVKKSSDMNKIMKQYRVEEVTSAARTKIQQQYLTQQLPKNRAEVEKAIRQIEKSRDVFVQFVYRLTDQYLKKIQPTFDMLFKMIQIILDIGEGQQAKDSLWVLKNQKAFDLLWKGYTSGEKATFRTKWESFGLDLSEVNQK